jgi:hypothetical protein
MTTYVEARDLLVSHLHTNWGGTYPTVPVFYENTTSVDLDSVGDAFLRAEISFEYAQQASMERTPITRVNGRFLFALLTKEGLGTRTVLGYIDYLTTLFKHRTLGGVQTATPTPMRSTLRDGWYYQELAVPFWFDNA